MSTESERISPAISFAFEKVAFETSEAAKIDYADRLEQIREWVGRMEANFRQLTVTGRATDEDAALVVAALFNPENTAKMRRGGLRSWWHRLFFYERYSTHRLLAPVAFGMFSAWFQTSGSLENIHIISAQEGAIRIAFFDLSYFSSLYIIAIIVATRVFTRVFPRIKGCGWGIALVFEAAIFYKLAVSWGGSVGHWLELANNTWHDPTRYTQQAPLWLNLLVAALYLFGYVVEAVMFFVVVALVFVETLNFPEMRRERRDLRRSGILLAR